MSLILCLIENIINLLLKLPKGTSPIKLVTYSYEFFPMPLMLCIIIDFCLNYLFKVSEIVSLLNIFSCRFAIK